jgi:hypothetical protein
VCRRSGIVGTGHLGYDAAGVVDEVGEGLLGFLWAMTGLAAVGRNTQAEYAVLDSWAAKPSSIDSAVAALCRTLARATVATPPPAASSAGRTPTAGGTRGNTHVRSLSSAARRTP